MTAALVVLAVVVLALVAAVLVLAGLLARQMFQLAEERRGTVGLLVDRLGRLDQAEAARTARLEASARQATRAPAQAAAAAVAAAPDLDAEPEASGATVSRIEDVDALRSKLRAARVREDRARAEGWVSNVVQAANAGGQARAENAK